MLDYKIIVLLALAGSLYGNSLQHQLNITIIINKPYIYQKNGTYYGALNELLTAYNRYGGPNCGPKGLKINYGPRVATYSDLLGLIKSKQSATSDSTIFAFAPVLPTTFEHSVIDGYNLYPILYSPGYTLVANFLTQTKIYRLIVFGFYESATLLVILIVSIVTIGSIVWFLERDKSAQNPDFSYHVLPGLWDGFWWAAVTISTVGYGDKVPRTIIGRAIGVFWLFFTCTLLASFGAIMTSSVTAEKVSISGKKIAYLKQTTAERIIIANAGLPVATKTPEEAWEMARNSEVYGAMLDTNYVSSIQDYLYDKGILIDQRFHGSENLVIRVWLRTPSGNNTLNSGNSSCLDSLKSFLNSTKDMLNYMQPMLKKNRHTTLTERLVPNSFNNFGLLISYCLVGCAIAFLIIVGITDYLMERRAKKVSITESIPMQERRREDVVAKLHSRLEIICSDISEIKSMIQEIEPPSKKRLESKDVKSHTMPNIV